jgi:glucose/mannose-6-phosphate isomerase
VTGGPGAAWLGLDSENMLPAVAGAAATIEAAMKAYVPISLPGLDAGGVTSVVVAATGASALASSAFQAFAAPRFQIPVVLVSTSSIPSFVGPSTLVFAVSFSGDTRATLDAASNALAAGAPLVAVTGDGPLGGLAAGAGAPVIGPPRGLPQMSHPRAALGATVASLLCACEQLGLSGEVRPQLSAAIAQLSDRSAELSSGGGVAARIGRLIGRTIPLVHGASGLGAVAARHWKTQVNANAKAPAFFGVQPEVCHDEVCGFGQHGDVTRQVLTLVNLRTGLESDGVAACFELFSELTSEALARIVDVEAAGAGDLARFFDLVMIGDFVSLHLAARDGIDPGPVPTSVELLERASRRR